jgi:endonuclease YncB( thermonuclease family)
MLLKAVSFAGEKIALFDFIAKRPVECSQVSLDQYGRTVATCSVGGTDLGEWLVSNGLALDWPKYSKGSGRLRLLLSARRSQGKNYGGKGSC